MADEERRKTARATLATPDLTAADREWLQANLALTGACAPPPPPPEPIKHLWTPERGRCVFCDEPRTAVRHWPVDHG
jgi:hypothetical protein